MWCSSSFDLGFVRMMFNVGLVLDFFCFVVLLFFFLYLFVWLWCFNFVLIDVCILVVDWFRCYNIEGKEWLVVGEFVLRWLLYGGWCLGGFCFGIWICVYVMRVWFLLSVWFVIFEFLSVCLGVVYLFEWVKIWLFFIF